MLKILASMNKSRHLSNINYSEILAKSRIYSEIPFSRRQVRNNHCLEKNSSLKFSKKKDCGKRSMKSFCVEKEEHSKLSHQAQFTSNFFFRQLFDRSSCTYTYLLADVASTKCVIIDPVLEMVRRDAKLIKNLGLVLCYCLNTHVHADHITGTGFLKKVFPQAKSVISKESGAMADVFVKEGDVIKFGEHEISVIETPGHTNGCVTYVCTAQSCAFTGDALLVRGCGRTDFQEGSSTTLYESIWNKIFTLPNNYRLYPAHDYNGQTVTSVFEEKKLNARLSKPKEQFVDIMANLNLSYPEMMEYAVPANKVCGLGELPENFGNLVDSSK